jgi:hypothetical protein
MRVKSTRMRVECDFDTHACDFHTRACNFYTRACDLDKNINFEKFNQI